jgi:hypothetical protein
MDNIISHLAQLTIDNQTATGAVDARFECLEDAFHKLTLTDPTPALSPSPQLQAGSSSSLCSNHEAGEELSHLLALDEKFDFHMKSILHHLDSLLSPNLLIQNQVKLNLLEEKHGLQSCLRELRGLESHPELDIWVIGEVMHNRIAQFTSSIDLYVEILQDRLTPSPAQQQFSTGSIATTFLKCYILNMLLDRFLSTNLRGKHMPSLVAILNVVTQNLFRHAT